MRHRPLLTALPLRSLVGLLCLLATVAAVCVVVAAPAPALATTRPAVTALSRDHGPYWGATQVTVRGNNFDGVQKVLFGHQTAYALRVLSPTKLIVLDPEHGYGTVHVRVVAATGTSVRRAADRFTFTRPTMSTPIMGGLTARQEQRISAGKRATHHGVHTARRSKHWTAATGLTAMRRARSWLGLPYSWAGGNSAGPTRGVCAHNGGDLDCHVSGFDCSGLAMYAWGPYRQLIHYAATQHYQAGRFHPAIGELMPGDLVFFSGYIANGIGHVAVYAGHGTVIEAAQSGTAVMRSRLVDVIAYSGRYRGATRPMSTGRQGTRPSVSSLTTQLPVNGSYLRITGRHLGAATSVSVGGQRIYSFVKRTGRHLVVKAPAHSAGRVSVSVSNAWGTAHRTLHYVAAPRIASLSPLGGPTTGGTTVTITGTSLTDVSQVRFGGTSVAFHRAAQGTLTFVTPAHEAGSVPVVVASPYGTSDPVGYGVGGADSRSSATRAGRTSSGPTGAGTTRAARVEPTPAATADGDFLADRIGDNWYLLGRRQLARTQR